MHSKLIAILYTLTHVVGGNSAENIVANILFLSFENAQIIHCIGYKVEKRKKRTANTSCILRKSREIFFDRFIMFLFICLRLCISFTVSIHLLLDLKSFDAN